MAPNSALAGLEETKAPPDDSSVEPKGQQPAGQMQGADGAGESQAPSETTPDYKALYEKSEADRRAEQGRIKTLERVPPWAEAIQQENRALRNRLDLLADVTLGDGTDLDAARKRHATMSQEEQTAAVLERNRKRSATWSQRATKRAERLEVDLNADVRTQEATRQWNVAAGRNDIDAVEEAYNALVDALDEVEETQKIEKRQEEKKAQVNQARESGKMKTDSGAIGGGAGNLSDRELERAVAKGTVVLTPAISKKLERFWNS